MHQLTVRLGKLPSDTLLAQTGPMPGTWSHVEATTALSHQIVLCCRNKSVLSCPMDPPVNCRLSRQQQPTQ